MTLVTVSVAVAAAVLKAVVTQASSAIPVVPLYISILFKVMKERHLHEDCLAHIDRLFREQLYGARSPQLDSMGRLRVDDRELRDDVQADVRRLWSEVSTDNILALTDLAGYRKDFLKIFGFEVDGIDYDADVSPLG